jgi:hypothetical protein
MSGVEMVTNPDHVPKMDDSSIMQKELTPSATKAAKKIDLL